jgi:ATP-dependent protease ClpP protease subunit
LRSGRADWYRIENHNADTADLYIYDEIGYFGVTASDLLNELAAVTAGTINVRINSPGGDVFDGIAIYNALLSHPATVNTTVDSLAASAASFITMAGETITMSPHSQMMIHDAHGLAIGNAQDMRDLADLLDRQSDNIASIYADRAGGSIADWRTAMKAETWYSAAEAVDAGLADTVAPKAGQQPTGADNTFDLSIFGYQGRQDAPEPFIPGRTRPRVAAVIDRDTFREAVQSVRPEPKPAPPAVNYADEFRRAFKEAIPA